MINDIFIWFFGEIDEMIKVLGSLLTIDLFLNVFTKRNKIKVFKTDFEGKLAIILLIAVANLLDKVIRAENDVIRDIVVIYYIGETGGNILSTISKWKNNVPNILHNTMRIFSKERDDRNGLNRK